MHAAAEVLGAQRVAFLGYRDSGMDGEPTTKDPECFAMADLDEAATRLAAILREEDAEVLTVYDERGNYGHPDHIQVHRVGIRAAAMAGTPRVYESTMNRDFLVELMTTRAAEIADIEDAPDPEEMELGMPAAMITTTVDVRDYVGRSAPRWSRTRARSPRTPSSSSCRPTRSRPRSARSGSSAVGPTAPPSRTPSSRSTEAPRPHDGAGVSGPGGQDRWALRRRPHAVAATRNRTDRSELQGA